MEVFITLLVFQHLGNWTVIAALLALNLYSVRSSGNYANDGCHLQVLQQSFDFLLAAPHQTYQLCGGPMPINKQEQVPV